MSKPIKVFNKGRRPIVYKRGRKGVEAIHPGKFLMFNGSVADKIIEKFENACSESDYKKHIDAITKEQKKETDKRSKSK